MAGSDVAAKLGFSLDELISGATTSASSSSARGAGDGGASSFGRAVRSATGSSARSGPYSGASASGPSSRRRVFVGNLPYSVTWQDLKDHMKLVGHVVRCDILSAPGTALGSKGCGTVEYSSSDEARKAIDKLTDTMLKGRPIWVREDREADSGRGRGSPSRTGSAGGGGGAGCSVFVGNLAFSVTWKDLKDHMREAGDVISADVMQEPGTAMGSKGCGIVRFASASAARRAIRDLTDTTLKGRAIFVREDREAHGGGGGASFSGRGGGGFGDRDRDRIRDRDRDRDRDRGRGGGSGPLHRPECRVFVGNLPYSVSWQELKDHMRQGGDVVSADIIGEPGTPLGSKGCGVVQYSTPGEAERAVRRMNETNLKGRNICCRMEKY